MLVKIGLTREERRIKMLEISRVRDGLTGVDSLLARFASLPPSATLPAAASYPPASSTLPDHPSLSKAQKKVLAELQAAAAELRRAKGVLEGLLPAAGAQSNEGKEMREQLALADGRLAQVASLEASIVSPFSIGPLSADPTSTLDPRADALAFLRWTTSVLKAAVERAESTVEDLVGAGSGDEDARQERVVRLLEWNEAREWVVGRLKTVEGMLEGGKVRPEKVLALREAVRVVVDANEDGPPTIDRTIFRPLGLDMAPATAPPSPTTAKAKAVSATRTPPADGLAGTHSRSDSVKKDGRVDDGGFQVVGPKKKPTLALPSLTQAGSSAPARAATATSSNALPDNYRTAPCRSFWFNGWCIWGSKCTFLHIASNREADFADRSWSEKKRPCQFFAAGNCRHSHCNLSHDVSLLPSKELLTAALTAAEPSARPTGPLASAAGSGTSIAAAPVGSSTLTQQAAICEAWKNGRCTAGARCTYAHGEAEQRTGPEIRAALLLLSNKQSQPTEYGYKERLCTNAEKPGGCLFLKNCVFAHGLDELVPSVAERKVTVCKHDRSPRGCERDDCLYLHPSRGPPLSSQPPPANKPLSSAPSPPMPQTISSLTDFDEEILELFKSMHQVKGVFEAPLSQTSPVAEDGPSADAALDRDGELDDTMQTETSPTDGTSTVPLDVERPSSHEVAPPVAPPFANPIASSAAATPSPQPTTILPSRLGPGACLNGMLLGRCANSAACLSRHTIGAEDVAAGILPMLGPGTCLTWFLRGACANGNACLARHVLTEADFASLPPSLPHEPSPPSPTSERPAATSTLKPAASAPVARKKAQVFFVSDEEEE